MENAHKLLLLGRDARLTRASRDQENSLAAGAVPFKKRLKSKVDESGIVLSFLIKRDQVPEWVGKKARERDEWH